MQILCDKNYKCEKTLQPNVSKPTKDSSDSSDSSDNDSNQKHRKKREKKSKKIKVEIDSTSDSDSDQKISKSQFRSKSTVKREKKETQKHIKQEKESKIISDQPQGQIKFNTDTASVQFPLSFNLNTNQQSTPKHDPANSKSALAPERAPSTNVHSAQIHALDDTSAIDIEQIDNIPMQTSSSCLIS